jgi:hypothetical protein
VNGKTVQITTAERRLEGSKLGIGVGEVYPLLAPVR